MSGGRIPVRRVTAGEAANGVFGRMEDAVRSKGSCVLVLAGGESPRPVYLELGILLTARIASESLFFLLGDERLAEPGSGERNETMVRESLFREFRPRPENLFFWDALPVPPEESAARYAEKIDDFLLKHGRAPDVALLGLGADGHTASLFPGAEAIVGGRRLPVTPDLPGPVFAVFVPGKNLWRLSLSAPFLRSCGETMFLAGGEGKDDAIARLARRDPGIPATWAAREDERAMILRL